MSTKSSDWRKGEWAKGARAAAGVMADYNGSTTHLYRLDDVILCKLNITSRAKPRKNPKPLEDPKKAMTRGLALGLADAHRIGGHSSVIVEAAMAAGLSIKECKEMGVDPYDWKELRKAGLK